MTSSSSSSFVVVVGLSRCCWATAAQASAIDGARVRSVATLASRRSPVASSEIVLLLARYSYAIHSYMRYRRSATCKINEEYCTIQYSAVRRLLPIVRAVVRVYSILPDHSRFELPGDNHNHTLGYSASRRANEIWDKSDSDRKPDIGHIFIYGIHRYAF
eukprot:6189254-Pleurochrysis_carterae.AAC.1